MLHQLVRSRLLAPQVLHASRRLVGVAALSTSSSSSSSSDTSRPKVNDLYRPGRPIKPCPDAANSCTRTPCVCSQPQARAAALASVADNSLWTASKVKEQTAKHSLFTWGASAPMSDAAIAISHGEGIYFYDMSGKRYIDFNSQAMCTHFGHSTPQSVIDAVVEQMHKISYTYPGISTTPVRAKLCTLLASIVPGDINAFLFPSSGAEANEIALRIARVFTGRHKVISRYRSYHGGTLGTMALTGDQRRWPAEIGATGVVHTFDPFPYSFTWGHSEDEIAERSIAFLREQIAYEGPKNIAAIFMESITGTNGILKPPRGYLEAVRQICDEHGILMVCDEVMAGFGRSGKLFGFCHAPSVVPDIITFAKGVNGATISLGGVGVRDHLAEHFRKNPLSIGSTYNGHPVGLASALASLRELLDRDLVGHAARMEQHMKVGLQRLIDNHPSVKQARVTGLFGCFDIAKNTKGDFVAEVTDPLTPAMAKFKAAVLERGLFTMMRGHTVFCNPPLIILPEQIKAAFDIFDDTLKIMDDAMER